MAIRLSKPWIDVPLALELLHGHLGVFQLADADGQVIYIGYAGGKSQFGLKAEVAEAAQRVQGAVQVRYEITTAYMSRFRELMMVHVADCGALPAANPAVDLGKLSPA